MTLDQRDLMELATDLSRDADIPQLSAAVLIDGEITSVAVGTPASTLFELASITKVWTASLVMQLVGAGSLDLDVPVAHYLPQLRFADAGATEGVTARHLLSHSSGIFGDHFVDTGSGPDALATYVESCAGVASVFPAGETTSYCSTGTIILGRLAEVLTGRTWDELVRERIMGPLGLKETAPLKVGSPSLLFARGHLGSAGSRVPAPEMALPRAAGPAGVISATATDLLTFVRGHLDSPPVEYEGMRVPQAGIPTASIATVPDSWGLGWGCYDWGSAAVIGHDGGGLGTSSYLRVVPEHGVALAVLATVGDAASAIMRMFDAVLARTAKVRVPTDPEPSTGATPDVTGSEGTYRRGGTEIAVTQEAPDRLRVVVRGESGPPTDGDAVAVIEARPTAEPGHFVMRGEGDSGWLPMAILTLPGGQRCLHYAARAATR